MPNPKMEGPFPFTRDDVDRRITKHQAGNYVLGRKNAIGKFVPEYVGRSDSDVNTRLKDHLPEYYTYFMFRYATSPKDAFECECRYYHTLGGKDCLDNKMHPDLPDDSKKWKCPVCE